MYRWQWLEARIRARPWIGLVILFGIFLLCVWILLSARGDRSPRSGAPMWVFAVAGIGLCGYATGKYVQEIRRRRRRRP